MNRMKKAVFAALAAFVALCALWPSAAHAQPAEDANLLQNASFEETDDSGLLAVWQTDAWQTADGYTQFLIEKADDGGNCVHIQNIQSNDARFIQTVAVEPGTLYYISARIKVANITEDSGGASVGVMDMEDSVPALKDTGGEWRELGFYGLTDEGQTELTIALRLGGYNNDIAGDAWFDDVKVVRADSVPDGAAALSLTTQSYSDSGGDGEEKQQDIIKEPQAYATIVLASLLWILFSYAIAQRFLKKQDQPLETGKSRLTYPFIIAITGAMLIRLVLGAVVEGFPTDIACFKGWSFHLAANGTWDFYDGTIFADYPPGYMYILLVLGWLQNLLGITSIDSISTLIIKLPAICADVLLAGFVYSVAARRAGTRWALGLAVLIAFNPASVLNTSLWGQIDSILALLLVLCGHFLLEKKNLRACLIFAVALLIKPQALFFAPIILYSFAHDYLTGDRRAVLMDFLKCLGAALALFIVAIIPFWGGQEPLWILDRYLSTATSYPYATVNAFNLFALLGANWLPDTAVPFLLSYRAWGYLLMAAVLVLSAAFFLKRPDKRKLWLAAAFLIAGVFTLGHNMHERYLFPAIFLLIMAYLELRDKRLIGVTAGFTVTFLFNAGVVLALGNIDPSSPALIVASAVQVLMFAYFTYVCWDICIRGRIRAFHAKAEEEVPPAAVRERIAEHRESRLGWTRRDTLLLTGLVLVYSIVAFINLGSMSVPQTYWRAQTAGAAAEITFDGTHSVAYMRYYGGIGDGAAEVKLVDDAGNQVTTTRLDQVESDMYRWIRLDIAGEASGAVIRVEATNVWLIETAFYDESGNRIPVSEAVELSGGTSFADQGSRASHLVDEQSLIPDAPTFMDEMYFDEIYHARTAYEHLNGLEFYETTHPPLGKLFIAAGIAVFGMDPFGWRVVGTLFGIGMLPVMYLFGRRIFKSPRYAFFTALLMALDCMHFVQTRIATIDVYGVFFIILMFYEMYRYQTVSFHNQPLRKTLGPLFLCGLFFGLGIASKWIGLYAGAGLAVLFFKALYDRWRDSRDAGVLLKTEACAGDAYLQKVRDGFRPAAIKTLLSAVAFFIVIPVSIYIASYIPILLAKEGNYTFGGLWEMQTFMYNYHSFLTATHPFSSQWWSWPVVGRPIWYYANYDLPEGRAASIAAFGNIAVWWGGLASSIALMIRTAGRKIQKDAGKLTILVALASNFLPWVLVTRATFIYHYFACVPFIILATVYAIRYIERQHPRLKWLIWLYLGAAALMFAFFYPAMSGMQIPDWYARLQEIMPTWTFYLH